MALHAFFKLPPNQGNCCNVRFVKGNHTTAKLTAAFCRAVRKPVCNRLLVFKPFL